MPKLMLHDPLTNKETPLFQGSQSDVQEYIQEVLRSGRYGGRIFEPTTEGRYILRDDINHVQYTAQIKEE